MRWLIAHGLVCILSYPLMVHADVTTPAWSWNRIELEARKFLLVARSSVTITVPSSDELDSQLVKVPGHVGLAPPASGVWRIDALSRAPGVDSRLTVWLARDSLQLLQRERVDSVHGGRYKLTRLLEDGSYEWQRRGDGAARGSDPMQWPLKRERLHMVQRSGVCTDSLGLLLMAAELAKSDRERMRVGVCTDEGSHDVVLTSQGDVRRAIAHMRVQGGVHTEVTGETTCRRVGMAAEGSRADVKGFRLLGLTGQLQVCVDELTGAPLRLQGAEPRLGEFSVDARLIESSQ